MKVVHLPGGDLRVARVVGAGPLRAVPVDTSGQASSAIEFQQPTPLATWTIVHNLGRLPYVDVYVGGELVEADVNSTPTTTTISFPAPYAGVAVLF